MKKLVVSFVGAAALATIGMAAASGSTVAYNNDSNLNAAGAFVSANLGYGDVQLNKTSTYFSNVPATLKTNGFAWNTNVGYQFNRHVAVEMGYTKFADSKFTYTTAASSGVVGSGNISVDGFNINIKTLMPISNKIDLFAKMGAARLTEKRTQHITSTTPASTTTVVGHAWAPMLGVGAEYNVTNHVAVNLQDVYTFRANFETTGNFGGAEIDNRIPSTNTILAGVSYKFNV